MLVQITPKQGETVSTSGMTYEFNELDFWRFFIRTMSFLRGNSLKDGEVEAMAFILAGSPYWSYFRKPHSKKLMEHLGVKTHQSLVNIRKVLEPAGFIEFTGELRGDYLVNKQLRGIQMLVKKLIAEGNLEELKLSFPIKIISDE